MQTINSYAIPLEYPETEYSQDIVVRDVPEEKGSYSFQTMIQTKRNFGYDIDVVWMRSSEEGEEALHKKDIEWFKKLDKLDIVSLGIPTIIGIIGIVDFFAHLPAFFSPILDLMLIIGGASLLFTSLALAKRLGLK